MKKTKLTKFDIPINFEIYGDDEDDAIFTLQKFLHQAIVTFGLDKEIVEHDLIEYISEADTKGNYG